MNIIAPNNIPDDRETGLQTAAGVQGAGKTYENMEIYANCIKDKFDTKVRGRKVLIFDTNGEYTEEEFAKNGHKNFTCKRLALGDVYKWCRSPVIECRRIDARAATAAQKKEALEYIMKHIKNCMFGLEDLNTYILQITNLEEIIGKLVSLRHQGVDVIVSFQSLRAVEPVVWRNSRWVRLHYQADDVDDIIGKVTYPELFKIAQLIVNNRYFNGDEYFHLTILNFKRKIEGPFSLREFKLASSEYLNIHEKLVKTQMKAKKMSEEQARESLTQMHIKQYWGNAA